MVFINANQSDTLIHHHLPQNVPRELVRVEIFELRNFLSAFSSLFLPFDEFSHTHPKIIYLPPLENLSKVLTEQHPLKFPVSTHNVNPLTLLSISHDFKSFPERPIVVNFNVLYSSCWEKRTDGDGVVMIDGGLVGDA